MSYDQRPTILRRIIASELRRLRQIKGVTQQEAESVAGLGQAALSRYESCTSSMQVPAAEKLFRYYGVDGEQLDALLQLVRGSRKRGLNATVEGTVWPPLRNLIILEQDASSIKESAIREIPGLLQTEQYARSVLKGGVVGAKVEQHVKTRMERAAIFEKPNAPEYWVVLCESTLRCAVGGKNVMRTQLNHLLELAENNSITLQVLPDAYGAHAAMMHPFRILRFEVAPSYGIVYMDYLTGSLYIDDADEVEAYDRAYIHLIKSALPEVQSTKLVHATLKELYI